jgi:hypothetical protein
MALSGTNTIVDNIPSNWQRETLGLNRMSRQSSALSFQLRISLDEIEPPIWRRVLVRRDTTLHELHRAIQVLFNWYDYHLYEFEVAGRKFQAPDEESDAEDATRAKLSRLITSHGAVLRYTYDFGDDWVHLIEVEDTAVPVVEGWIPWLLAGARSGPPEDCGGPHGYSELVAALRQPFEDLDDEERATVEWSGPDFDPEEFNLLQARHALLLCSAWGVLKRR